MMNQKTLQYLKKYFPEELKNYRITIYKTEAGKVVTAERLRLTENMGQSTMLKYPRNPKKPRVK